jgi:hypothetical protein
MEDMYAVAAEGGGVGGGKRRFVKAEIRSWLIPPRI